MSTGKIGKKPIDIHAPKIPPHAYSIFCNERLLILQQKYANKLDIMKMINLEWKLLSNSEKQKYEIEASELKTKYKIQLSEYLMTDNYKKYENKLKHWKSEQNKSMIKNGYLYIYRNHKIGSTKYPRHRIGVYQTMEIDKVKYDAVFLIDKNHKMDCYSIDEQIKNDENRKFQRFCEIGHNGGTELYQHSTNKTLTEDLKEWLNLNNIKYKQVSNEPSDYPRCYREYIKKESKLKQELHEKQSDEQQLYETYILITKGNYDDHIKSLNGSQNGLFELIWEGQAKKSIHDDTVCKGTHVFFRNKGRIPFNYKGIVIKKTVLRKRSNKNPIKLKLIVDDRNCKFKADTLCNKIINNEYCRYQNACWRTLNLPKFNANGYGIYKVLKETEN